MVSGPISFVRHLVRWFFTSYSLAFEGPVDLTDVYRGNIWRDGPPPHRPRCYCCYTGCYIYVSSGQIRTPNKRRESENYFRIPPDALVVICRGGGWWGGGAVRFPQKRNIKQVGSWYLKVNSHRGNIKINYINWPAKPVPSHLPEMDGVQNSQFQAFSMHDSIIRV